MCIAQYLSGAFYQTIKPAPQILSSLYSDLNVCIPKIKYCKLLDAIISFKIVGTFRC